MQNKNKLKHDTVSATMVKMVSSKKVRYCKDYTWHTLIYTLFYIYNFIHHNVVANRAIYHVVKKVAHFWYLSFLPY